MEKVVEWDQFILVSDRRVLIRTDAICSVAEGDDPTSEVKIRTLDGATLMVRGTLDDFMGTMKMRYVSP